jgi:hypothetical protein
MLRVVGAGLGRTGTTSLKAALEQLLGGRCYHMLECFTRPDDPPVWQRAAEGGPVDWDEFLAEYVATVDWPASPFWRPLADANPEAVILLSTRATPEDWFRSAANTIFGALAEQSEESPWHSMWFAIADATFTRDVLDKDKAIAAYERHNAEVRATADPARLLEWQPGDGWEPLCERLGVPVPDDPFPRLNTSEEWLNRSE